MLHFQTVLINIIFCPSVLGNSLASQVHSVDPSEPIQYAFPESNVNGDIIQPKFFFPPGTQANAYRPQFTGTWNSATIPYTVDAIIDNDKRRKKAVKDAVKEFDRKTCIKFVPRTFEQDFVHIMDGGGCYSYVGRIGGMQNLSLGPTCMPYTGVLMHEMMHVLKFLHEHTRFDRDQYVDIRLENVLPGAQPNFNKFDQTSADTMGLPYDYNSLMHYGKTYFSSNGQDTIVPKNSRERESRKMGQRAGFSDCDLNKINTLYPCPKRKLNKRCKDVFQNGQGGGPIVTPVIGPVVGIGCFGTGYNGPRLSLQRLYSDTFRDSFYTINQNEAFNQIALGYQNLGSIGSMATSSSDSQCQCLKPLYKLRKEAGSERVDHFYTADEQERVKAEREGYAVQGFEGYCVPTATCGATLPLYRLYSNSAFDHLYTTSMAENQSPRSGYKRENIECYIWL